MAKSSSNPDENKFVILNSSIIDAHEPSGAILTWSATVTAKLKPPNGSIIHSCLGCKPTGRLFDEDENALGSPFEFTLQGSNLPGTTSVWLAYVENLANEPVSVQVTAADLTDPPQTRTYP